jgi:N-acyl-D-amino-acid deacylase
MGVQDRKPTETEFRKMKDWAAEAMRGGAVGMSTGLVSPPGTYSETDEIVELAKVISSGGGIYASHIRGEAGTVVDAVREAIEIGKKANIRVEISHHKSVGKENWGKTKTTLPMIEKANRRDRPVRCDVYPYRAGSAGLAQLVPPWAHEGGRGAMLDRLSQPGLRKRIARDITEGTGNWPNFFVIDWNDIQIVSVSSKANQKWIGRKVADVARSRGCSGAEACIDLLLEERGSVGMINFVIDEKEMHGVLKHPLSMVGSDGSAISPDWYRGSPHPRFYGCFPRVIGRYCRDLKLFDLETAIKKMTSMPAKHLHLNDRGVIRSGYAADIVIFDFEKIIDKATFSDPHQYPVGIDTVIVNGKLVIHGGDHTDSKPGRVLRPDHA